MNSQLTRPHILALATLIAAATPQMASAVIIDNDIPLGTVGAWSVDVTTGGESRQGDLTANRLASGDVYTENTLYDYFTYVDTGSGGFRLSGSAPVLTGDDEVTSTGSFAGAAGNTINWEAVSTIADGSSLMVNTFTFTAVTGTLGALRLYQYMDEDIQGVGDDVFFTRGSVGGADLELYTVDNTEVYGVSHSGALTVGQGLVDAIFAGWGVCEYNSMKPAIEGGTQGVSTTGDFCGLLTGPFVHPEVGTAWGPQDIVSVLAWDALAGATSATIITTLGGVPDVTDIPDENGSVPLPGSLLLLAPGLLALRRRMRQG